MARMGFFQHVGVIFLVYTIRKPAVRPRNQKLQSHFGPMKPPAFGKEPAAFKEALWASFGLLLQLLVSLDKTSCVLTGKWKIINGSINYNAIL